ncbi:MAG: class I SAM-dependent methyltransferase [Lachnospiraceae bacterium]|jgi:ubiquinone/menaquinone biosynthesis C-methylase UbiE|nr:class I SAM-dependent methyltransferase [Lachnospiraceae bacterium]
MGNELLRETMRYWTDRARSYSDYNQKELLGEQGVKWIRLLHQLIKEHLPERDSHSVEVLDVGTGPGFFATLLAAAGYHVTGIDCTEAMLEEASQNTKKFRDHVSLWKMEADSMFFPDESFDVIVSRNVTWNLQNPEKAYLEWHRVLKEGGLLLNFDANWYRYLFDKQERIAYEQDRAAVERNGVYDHYTHTDIPAMEAIALQMPLSKEIRPAWDVKVLQPYFRLDVNENVGKLVYSAEELLNYRATPMFMIHGIKEKKDESDH